MSAPLFFSFGPAKTRGMPIIVASSFENGKNVWNPPHPLGTLLAETSGDYKRWKDVLWCSGDVTNNAFSEHVIKDLQDAGVQFEYGPIALTCMVKPVIAPPHYFYLCLPAGVELDIEKGDIGLMTPVKPETWTKADLFVSSDRRKRIYCSYRIVELARRKRWSNIRFTLPPGILKDVSDPVRDVDYLAAEKNWPPAWLSELLDPGQAI